MKTWRLNPNELNLRGHFPSGNGVMAICENPDHDDKNPSMKVDLVEQTFYCFSCGFKGTVDKLIDLTEGHKKWEYKIESNNKFIGNEWKQFLNEPLAIDSVFLTARDITNDIVEQYGIRESEDKITIPLKNTVGEIVGLKVRLKNKLESGVKYLTFGQQPDYICNSKFVVSQTPFTINKRVWVTEGMFGLMRLSHEGLTGLTPLSANRLNGLFSLFKQTPYNQYMIMFDPDYAGYLSAMKMLYDCRGLDNVFVFNQLVDIDLMSSEAIHELATSDLEKTCTTDWSFVLNKIGVNFGSDAFRSARDSIKNNIERKYNV